MKAFRRFAVFLAAVSAVVAVGARPAIAATITVNSFAQDGPGCTIANAIEAAENDIPVGEDVVIGGVVVLPRCAAGSGADVIKIPAGTYTIYEPYEHDFYGNSTAFPYVTTDITIEGEYKTVEPLCPTDGRPRAVGCDTIIERYSGSFFTFRFFTIEGRQFAIKDLILRGGLIDHSEGGGAILARAFRAHLFQGPPRIQVSISNVRLTDNAAPKGGAVADTGFFFGPFVDFTIEGSTFTSNRATGYGGGVFVSPGSSLTLRHSHFENNNGGEWGGAVATLTGVDAPFDIADSLFLGNEAVQSGGAIYNTSPRLTRVVLRENHVRDGGGALGSYGGRPIVIDSTFDRNWARKAGAIDITAGSVEISGSTFTDNRATDHDGGALLLDDRTGTSRIVNSTFSGNQAFVEGTAISIKKGGLTLVNDTITLNTTSGSWGAAVRGWWDRPTISVSNSIIAGNSTNNPPLDIYVDQEPERDDALISLGHNVIGNDEGTRGVFVQPRDKTGNPASPLNPGLLDIADNGGPTQTHALDTNSPALDYGSTAAPGTIGACEPFDQRGQPRPGPPSLNCDSGAFEQGVYYPVTLTVDGTGFGAVTGVPGFVDCRAGVCSAVVGSGMLLRLTAHTSTNSVFTGWTGACTGDFPVCLITVGDVTDVTATFTLAGGETTTTLTSSPNPSGNGEEVTFTATVTAKPPAVGSPTGMVRFLELTTKMVLGDATLDANGQASVKISDLTQGLHGVNALYLGDTAFSVSTASSTHTVGIPANVAPSFSMPSLAPTVGTSAGLQSLPQFAFAMIAGPAHEAGQSLLGFTVTRVSEIGDIAFTMPPALDLNGALTYAAAENTAGVATFTVTLRDDGGTASGGQDTSVPRTFSITVLGPPPPVYLDIVERIAVHGSVTAAAAARLTILESVAVSDDVRPVRAVVVSITETIQVDDAVSAKSDNTPPGSHVHVEPESGVTVTFSSVTESGVTTATAGSVPAAPPGLTATTPPVGFDISTSAGFSGVVTVCLRHPPATIPPVLMHFESGAWVDRTTMVNSAASTVCGSVTSLSPFAAFVPLPQEGRMTGHGELAGGHEFDFRVAERSLGNERGALKFQRTTPKSGKQKARTDTFRATVMADISFWDNAAQRPSRRPRPTVDSVVFTGSGNWNGTPGYSFEVEATDEGEPGRGRDSFTIIIRSPEGWVVASTGDVLGAGNIQSHRIRTR